MLNCDPERTRRSFQQKVLYYIVILYTYNYYDIKYILKKKFYYNK